MRSANNNGKKIYKMLILSVLLLLLFILPLLSVFVVQLRLWMLYLGILSVSVGRELHVLPHYCKQNAPGVSLKFCFKFSKISTATTILNELRISRLCNHVQSYPTCLPDTVQLWNDADGAKRRVRSLGIWVRSRRDRVPTGVHPRRRQ